MEDSYIAKLYNLSTVPHEDCTEVLVVEEYSLSSTQTRRMTIVGILCLMAIPGAVSAVGEYKNAFLCLNGVFYVKPKSADMNIPQAMACATGVVKPPQ